MGHHQQGAECEPLESQPLNLCWSVPCLWVQVEQDHCTGLCSNHDTKRPQTREKCQCVLLHIRTFLLAWPANHTSFFLSSWKKRLTVRFSWPIVSTCNNSRSGNGTLWMGMTLKLEVVSSKHFQEITLGYDSCTFMQIHFFKLRFHHQREADQFVLLLKVSRLIGDSRSSDKTHYQKDTRPWHDIGEGGGRVVPSFPVY